MSARKFSEQRCHRAKALNTLIAMIIFIFNGTKPQLLKK